MSDEFIITNGDVSFTPPPVSEEIIVMQGPPGQDGTPGPVGPAGPPNSLAIGTVTSGATPSASITGAAPNQTLNLVLAKGDTGPAGPPGAGSVSTVNGDPGPNVTLTAASVGAAPTTHTHAEADITGLTTDLAAKVPTTRTVSAGTGLTGGGDLSANRTFTVSYGTAAGTAAQGNDSRLSDARTPTAHKATHATGGSDALVPTDIGAANRVKGGDEAVATPGTTTGTVTLDCSAASIFTVSPTGAVTLTPSNVPATGHGCTITVIVSQGASVQAVALPTGGVWLGSAPTQTASKACVITMLTTNGGTTWYCSGVVQA